MNIKSLHFAPNFVSNILILKLFNLCDTYNNQIIIYACECNNSYLTMYCMVQNSGRMKRGRVFNNYCDCIQEN